MSAVLGRVAIPDRAQSHRNNPWRGEVGSWVGRVRKIEIGSTVAYSKAWLQSAGAYTGPLPFARGKVTALEPLGDTVLAEVDWGDPDIPPRVNVANLVPVKDGRIMDRE